jgi:nitrosocyanin
LVVKKGTTVEAEAHPQRAGWTVTQHGFAIPAYGIAEVVDQNGSKSIEFKAEKDGIFPINCQLHPAHVGGELVVLP